MKVFVYGTLKSAFNNNSCMIEAKGIFCYTFITPPIYDLIDFGGFPGLIYKHPGYCIFGEIWEVPQSGIENYLDVLEGHPNFYKRQHIGVETISYFITQTEYIDKLPTVNTFDNSGAKIWKA